MSIHNYWWLLIWSFLFGGISFSFIPKQEEYVLGERVVRWHWLTATLLALPYAIWAGWRIDGFGDTGVYRSRFMSVPTGLSQIWSYTINRSKDKGFALLEVVFKTFVSHSDIAFFFFIACIQILCLVYIYRKYSRNYWLSMFLFVASTDYLSWMHNGMRQFLAAALIFAAIPLLTERRYVLMTLVVLLASQFHLTARIFLPFIFIVNGRAWNIRTLAFMAAVIISVFFLDKVTGFITGAMEDTAYENNIDLFLNDDGTNLFRVLLCSGCHGLAVPTLYRQSGRSADQYLCESVYCCRGFLCVQLFYQRSDHWAYSDLLQPGQLYSDSLADHRGV